jgi:predicted acylesterase/phospholipase RssA
MDFRSIKRRSTVAAITLISGTAIGALNAGAYDYSSKSAFLEEWQQQYARVAAGRKSGVLSRAEARMLRRELDALGAMGYNSKSRDMLSRHSKKIAAYKSPTGE